MFRPIPTWAWFVIMPAIILGACVLILRHARSAPTERPYTPEDVEATKSAAKPIIAAIEKYRAAKGHPPWTLKALTNEYLDRVPEPAAPFGSWYYDLTEDRRSYALGFSASATNDHAWWWQPEDQRWNEVKP